MHLDHVLAATECCRLLSESVTLAAQLDRGAVGEVEYRPNPQSLALVWAVAMCRDVFGVIAGNPTRDRFRAGFEPLAGAFLTAVWMNNPPAIVERLDGVRALLLVVCTEPIRH